MPSSWLTVTTPVPPIPGMRTITSSAGTMRVGTSRARSSTATSWPAVRERFFLDGTTETNDGHSPRRQLSSLLHEPWLIRVLRPNSVSTGSTDRQFDFTPQSPQPSQTLSLMAMRREASGIRPRLRARRFSFAHSWSWMSTVTPGTERSATCASTTRVRSHTSTPRGRRIVRYRSRSSVVISTLATPCRSNTSTRSGTGIALLTDVDCPPVMAMAPFQRSLKVTWEPAAMAACTAS